MEEEKKKEFFCTKCSLQFNNAFVFNLHLSLVHKIKNDSTSSKNQPNMSIEILESVDVSKFGENEEPIENGKTKWRNINKLKSKPTLYENVSSKPDMKKGFKCEKCDKSFSRKSSINRHVASVHDGKKSFQCEICDYSCFRNRT